MYRHEPLTARVLELIADGAIGAVRDDRAGFTFAQSREQRRPARRGARRRQPVGRRLLRRQRMPGSSPAPSRRSVRLRDTGTPSGVDEAFTGLLRFAERRRGHDSQQASARRYRIWLEVVGQRRRAARSPNPFRPGPRETHRAERGDERRAHRGRRARRCCSCGRSRTSSARALDGRPPACRSPTAAAMPRRRSRRSTVGTARREVREPVAMLSMQIAWTPSRADGAVAALSVTGAATGERSRAVILPGGPPYTLTFFVNDVMDRAENFDTMDIALFRADEVKRSLARRRLEGRLSDPGIDKRHRTVPRARSAPSPSAAARRSSCSR